MLEDYLLLYVTANYFKTYRLYIWTIAIMVAFIVFVSCWQSNQLCMVVKSRVK